MLQRDVLVLSLFFLLYLLFGVSPPVISQNDYQLDDFIRKDTIQVTMSDSVRLEGYMYRPVLQRDLTQNISRIGNIVIAEKGTQYIQFPEHQDPYKLPVLFSRTPYNKESSQTGRVAALLGYCGIDQDMRGRYGSEGTYYPLYSDSWSKVPYYNSDSIYHSLDKTPQKQANRHRDGAESLEYILNGLYRPDSTKSPANLVCNGKVGMFGASAMGNSQLQLAASVNNQNGTPGLKCLIPVVATGEYYNSAGFNNGVFRESLISGWLGSQINNYNFVNDPNDNSVLNGIHSVQDFPQSVNSPEIIRERAIDFWTTMNRAAYPDSKFRTAMDISQAPVDENGRGLQDGSYSRYTNLDVPVYHLTGWWDIFINGQIDTWQKTMKHLRTANRNKQKLIIGPFAHQTIGSRQTGDVTYRENVLEFLKIQTDQLQRRNVAGIVQSEIYDWLRVHLGEPEIVLPESDQWQDAGPLGTVRVPSEDYMVSFRQFFNYLNGTGSLDSIPYKLNSDTNSTAYINLPRTNESVFGDESDYRMPDEPYKNFDQSGPDGVPNVRFYVPGPLDDGISANNKLGNYWFASDTFPVPDLTHKEKLYLQTENRLSRHEPEQNNHSSSYIARPDEPVYSLGGNNMLINTPDDQRRSQGQMNLATPGYEEKTMNRQDVLQFQSGAVQDSFSIMGYPQATLYAKSRPLAQQNISETQCDFFVRILDVYPDGREYLVCEGAVNVRYRAYAASLAAGAENENAVISNIEADSVYQYTFRLLPIAYTWGSQHKIKILISSSLYPKYQSNTHIPLEDGDYLRAYKARYSDYNFEGNTVYERASEQTVYFSQHYPSHITLPGYGKSLTTEQSQPVKHTSDFHIRLFPNPASTVLNIGHNTMHHIRRLRIYAPDGSTIIEKYNLHDANLHIDVSNLEPGLYFLKVETPDGKFTVDKFIKE